MSNPWYARVFHYLTDHHHYEHPLDRALSSHPGGLIGHVTPGESITERRSREDTLHVLRGGRVAADPNRNHPSRPDLHLVDRGGMPGDHGNE